MKIYLAMAVFGYDCTLVIRAFYKKDKANLFIKNCAEYEKTYIPCSKNTADNNEIFNKWWENNEKWLKNHPAEKDNEGVADKYYIKEVEIQ